MSQASDDDELLSIVRLILHSQVYDSTTLELTLSQLLVNLRNAAATFGEGSPPHETVRTTIEDHLQAMKAKGSSTNIAVTRGNQQQAHQVTGQGQTSSVFGSLAFRPKPS